MYDAATRLPHLLGDVGSEDVSEFMCEIGDT
jgi:hypothetical protein